MREKEHKQDTKIAAVANKSATAEPEVGEKPSVTKDQPATAVTKPAMVTLTAAEVEELKAEATKAREHWDRLLRTTADFDNFKKRVARERQEAAKYAYAALFEKLLPVLDHFDMALAAADNSPLHSAASLQAGIAMVYQQLRTALAEAGLQEIDAQRQRFDPRWHEAVSTQVTSDIPEGQVVQQLRKGFKLHDRLLRPAGVVVASKPAEAPETPDSSTALSESDPQS